MKMIEKLVFFVLECIKVTFKYFEMLIKKFFFGKEKCCMVIFILFKKWVGSKGFKNLNFVRLE